MEEGVEEVLLRADGPCGPRQLPIVALSYCFVRRVERGGRGREEGESRWREGESRWREGESRWRERERERERVDGGGVEERLLRADGPCELPAANNGTFLFFCYHTGRGRE
jgi:hypothetical protein